MFESFFKEALKLLNEEDFKLKILMRLANILDTSYTRDNIYIPGYQILFENGLTLLTHYNPITVQSPPHDHGKTWVIYGVVTGTTAMTEYKKINHSKVRPSKFYCLLPGQAALYDIGDIHSHITFGDSKYIRIEGANMHNPNNPQGDKSYEIIC